MLESDYTEHVETDEEAFAEPPGHIGLYNTNKRLKLTYGEQYRLRLLSKYGWGTVVQIRIPVE